MMMFQVPGSFWQGQNCETRHSKAVLGFRVQGETEKQNVLETPEGCTLGSKL